MKALRNMADIFDYGFSKNLSREIKRTESPIVYDTLDTSVLQSIRAGDLPAEVGNILTGNIFKGIAGEDLEPGQPVYISPGTEKAIHRMFRAVGNITNTTVHNLGDVAGGNEKLGQMFVAMRDATITRLGNLVLDSPGAPIDAVRVGIQGDSGGSPDGSFIGSATSSTDGFNNFDISVPVTKGVKYHVVAERTGAFDAINYWTLQVLTSGDTHVYNTNDASGEVYNGTSWSVNNDLAFELLEDTAVAGRIYKSVVRVQGTADYIRTYIGINTQTSPKNNRALVVVSGFVAGLKSVLGSGTSAVTAGSRYGVGVNEGTITTNVPTSRPVGLGVETSTRTISMMYFT